MSLVFLQVEIESEWGVHIPSTQFAAWLRTFKQVADYIADRLPEQGASLTPAVSEGGGCHENKNSHARHTIIRGTDGARTG